MKRHLPIRVRLLALPAVMAMVFPGCQPSTQAISLVRIPKATGTAGKATLTDEEYMTRINTHMSLLQSRAVVSQALEKPGIVSLPFVAKIIDPVEWLEANLSVDNPGGSEIVSVALRSSSADGKDAMKVVDAIVEAYLDEVGQDVASVVQPATTIP